MAEKEYIEREAAYQFFKDQLEEETGAYSKGRNAGLRVAMSAVMNNDAIPAADVRSVVKARWIHVPSDGKFRDTCVCSACKKSPPIESWVVQGFNACPYCFADMREES